MAHGVLTDTRSSVSGPALWTARPAYKAYVVLFLGFIALPILAGLDKFFHLLVNWDQYLAPLASVCPEMALF
jgi:hypothetical protein